MRKIIEWSYISADGIFEDPLKMNLGAYADDAYLRDAVGVFEAADAILFGRTTYEIFAKIWSNTDGSHPYAARLTSIKKYIYSSTLEATEWNNSTIVRGNVIDEVTKLKQPNGRNLLVLGHGLLGETLLRHRLIDVVDLSILPLIVGHGKTYFREGQNAQLKLVSTKSFSKIVKLSYEAQY